MAVDPTEALRALLAGGAQGEQGSPDPMMAQMLQQPGRMLGDRENIPGRGDVFTINPQTGRPRGDFMQRQRQQPEFTPKRVLSNLEEQVPGQDAEEQGETTPDNEQAEGGAPTDEQMLEQVRQGMGRGEQPAQGGMEWKDVDADRAALEEDPTDGNISAFVDYWGEGELPPDMQPQKGKPNYARPPRGRNPKPRY